MLSNKTAPLFTIIGLLCLAGCAHYNARPLKKLAPSASPHIKERFVSVSYRLYDKNDCEKYLGRKDILKKGYQPIQFTITNNTKKTLYISNDSFSFTSTPAHVVAKKVHTDTTGRVLAYGIPGMLFMWPFLVPAVVDGIGSSRANAELDEDFDNKEIEDAQIQPFSTANGVVFTPLKSFKDNFSITLTDIQSNKPIILKSNNRRVSIEETTKKHTS